MDDPDEPIAGQAAGRGDESPGDACALPQSRGPILLCVGASPYGEALVRAAHQIATDRHAAWHAAYVESHKPAVTGPHAQARVWGTLQYAESLGAKAAILTGTSPTEAILAYAHQNQISQIIIGNSDLPTWQRMLGLSFVDRLLRHSQVIDLHIISHTTPTAPARTQTVRRHRIRLWRYAAAIGLTILATILGLPARGFITPASLITSYLLVLVVSAVYLGFGAAALTAICSAVAFDFFYLPPYYHLTLPDWGNLLPMVGFLVIGAVINTLVERARRQANAARQREEHTHALYLLSRDLAGSIDLDTILETVIDHWRRIFGSAAAVVLLGREDPQVGAASPDFETTTAMMDLAAQAFRRARYEPLTLRAERLEVEGTPALPIVLETAHGVVGVLLASRTGPSADPTPEEWRMIEVFASQAALAIERAQFARQAHEAEVLRATEVLQSALLSSVSHDLRTPLSSITGVLSTLAEESHLLNESTQKELTQTALAEARRLNRLVGNLLDMTRIEANALQMAQDLNEVQDVIGTTLVNLEPTLSSRPIDVQIDERLPLVPMDFVLISRVLHNLIENGDKYAPVGTPLEIQAHLDEGWLEISVADQGPGVPEGEEARIFDKFYRSQRTQKTAGTGLGLAISKGIVTAHGGSIWAENQKDSGLRVTIRLPLDGQGPSSHLMDEPQHG